jgi:hypothetical protein
MRQSITLFVDLWTSTRTASTLHWQTRPSGLDRRGLGLLSSCHCGQNLGLHACSKIDGRPGRSAVRKKEQCDASVPDFVR